MRLSTFAIIVCLLSCFLPLPVAGGGNRPADAVHRAFSADDFDWRKIVPYLYEAAGQPGEQGLQTMLENSKVMRAHVLNEVRAECKPGNNRCDSNRDGFTMDGEATRRIDGIVREAMVHRHKTVSVDYALEGQPFPFSDIGVLKSDNRQDAYLILKFSDHVYTAAEMQAKYGAPYDTNIFQMYSIFKYRLENKYYKSNAVFEVDPADGAVLRVAISLKAKKGR
ncbi:MAG: hypothetical protein ACLQLC_13935 [Candidatus Sulfotelmatobacter sp.]